jgi:hypothetical protein
MGTPRYHHAAVRLLNGQVLITGGNVSNPQASADLYDPSTGLFTAIGPTTMAGVGIPTLLPDGRVLIIGKEPSVGMRAELYDPSTGIFKITGNRTMVGASLATLLNDGRVLIMGGDSSRVRAEIYDPATGTFSATDNTPNIPETATLLANGNVLVTWNYWDGESAYVRGAALYDPSAHAFISIGTTAKYHNQPSATLLKDGKVLIAGGDTGEGGGGLISAELYDPETRTFTPTGNLITGRESHTATLLPDGSVLIAGGHCGGIVMNCDSDNLASAELYDAVTGTFHSTGSMAVGRDNHAATLLNDGVVLITGGVQYYPYSAGLRQPSLGSLTSAELYAPSVLASIPVVTNLRIDRTSVVAGSSYSVDLSGSNLSSQTFFDVRFTSPGNNRGAVVLNWQIGPAASHDIPIGTISGKWTINGVRPHEIETDHTGNFFPVSATIMVSP